MNSRRNAACVAVRGGDVLAVRLIISDESARFGQRIAARM
jgi:hypothetical protein